MAPGMQRNAGKCERAESGERWPETNMGGRERTDAETWVGCGGRPQRHMALPSPWPGAAHSGIPPRWLRDGSGMAPGWSRFRGTPGSQAPVPRRSPFPPARHRLSRRDFCGTRSVARIDGAGILYLQGSVSMLKWSSLLLIFPITFWSLCLDYTPTLFFGADLICSRCRVPNFRFLYSIDGGGVRFMHHVCPFWNTWSETNLVLSSWLDSSWAIK